MQPITNAREAKDFLVARIAAQAQQDGVPLSDIERKMLYFSETALTLPDMAEVNAEFDRLYNQPEYERKIGKIIRSIRGAPVPEGNAERGWDDAVRVLRADDHYLVALIDAAGPVRPSGDLVKLFLAALAIVAGLVLTMFFLTSKR